MAAPDEHAGRKGAGKRKIAMLGTTALLAACAAGTSPSVTSTIPTQSVQPAVTHVPEKHSRPNIVVILADDLGWPDVSSYGRSDVPTPNIDRIAQSGVAFSSGYVAASVCAVSRAGLLTGRMPARFGFTYNISDGDGAGKPPEQQPGLPLSEQTLAERLKPLGYRTGAIGKWHQGTAPIYYPTNRGFDEFFGFLTGETVYVDPATPGIVTTSTKVDKYPLNQRRPNAGVVEGPDARPVNDFDKYLTDEITSHAVDFIRRSAGGPFFAYIAYNAPHWPLQVPQKWYDRFASIKDPVRRTYVAMIAAMDDGVGQVLDALDRAGQRENTIILFLSDNGCPVQFGFCNPDHAWAAGKFTYLEGGVRVPFVFSWPARLQPRGIVDTPVSSLDLVPTVLRAVDPDAPLPQGLDGEDILATLEHPPVTPRLLLWGQEPVFAARQGTYKYWRDYERPAGNDRLFEIDKDPWERQNLASENPAKRGQFRNNIENWRQTLPSPLWPKRFTRSVVIDGRETTWVY